MRKRVKDCFQGLELQKVFPTENGEAGWKDGDVEGCQCQGRQAGRECGAACGMG